MGLVCAAGLAVAWAFALWVPSGGLTLEGVGGVGGALMSLVLAAFAGIAAVHGHAAVIALVFLASFFPIPAFFNTPSWPFRSLTSSRT